MKILIIENSQEVSIPLKYAIEKWGHTAVIAQTGQEALDIIRLEIYDLIILDIFLPDTAADQLIPILKKEWAGMEIITITGYSSAEIEKKIRSQGILYYMVKPVNLKELKSIIRQKSEHMKFHTLYQDDSILAISETGNSSASDELIIIIIY